MQRFAIAGALALGLASPADATESYIDLGVALACRRLDYGTSIGAARRAACQAKQVNLVDLKGVNWACSAPFTNMSSRCQ